MSGMFDLSGKSAMVTGCSRGLGRAMAEALAAAGADIVGVSSSLDADSEVARAVRAMGREFSAHRCDFSDRADVRRFAKQVMADEYVPDILVNNAGILKRKPAVDHDDALWDQVIDVDLSSQFVLTREIGRGMVARGSGKIIFTASVLSFQGGLFVPGYAAAKGGVVQLAKALANEWAAQGVNVNAIAPGYVETEMTGELRGDQDRADAILARIPQGRWARPDDFAGPVVFLASSASDYVNGTVLTVDGGWMGR
ncbi:SDR family oxidoreductase [Actibacterium pelagium]|uniref:2-deoxy-D-gluconate 3-dehydrogenase n=1 Tax=Actibacterium pelagium TaxID=2029103 RepID=A0A917AL16_9RHOB|nr:SDR family oxidoreductase [Actibacterium pelagium]GGE58382.1 2-deoxy-D-gluconate 3-dehydrogenase [Actibacterium pelagium]